MDIHFVNIIESDVIKMYLETENESCIWRRKNCVDIFQGTVYFVLKSICLKDDFHVPDI